MKKTIFIQANESQHLGALLSKYSIERSLGPGSGITVQILKAEEIPAFKQFVGKTYLQGSEERTYSLTDEQSFTLTRFMPPEIMRYEGRAIVIDPDIFAVEDISPLFDLDLGEHAVACCGRADGKFWDTSVMLLACDKLDWNIVDILQKLANKEMNYNTAVRNVFNEPVLQISREWNTLDEIRPNTKFVHMTRQRTQPWKTGLPYTVTPRRLGKLFGIIPREWLSSGKTKYPETYQEHPDSSVKHFFFTLLNDALKEGVLTKQYIEDEITAVRIRPDILSELEKYE